MRKVIGYIIGAAISVVSCHSSIMEYPENGGIDPTTVHVNLSLSVDPTLEPHTKTATTAQTEGETTHDVRWIIEILREDAPGEPLIQRVVSTYPTPDGRHTLQTAFDLNAAKYKVVAWVDYVDSGSQEDKYYTTSSLSSIRIADTEQYIGDETHKDTYAGNQTWDLTPYRDQWGASIDQTLTLTRPMAKIEFITTDIDQFLVEQAEQYRNTSGTAPDQVPTRADIASWQVRVAYAGYLPSSFNAYTDSPNDARQGVAFTTTMTPLSDQEARLSSDYIFVNGIESTVQVNLTLIDDQGKVLNEVNGLEVPIARGKLTTIRDAFLTQDFAPGIGIDTGFDGDIDIVIPD